MNHTLERLQSMKLKGMLEAYRLQLEQPDMASLSFEERFSLLVDYEWTARQNRKLARQLKQARLRLPACPEDIDFRHPRGLDRSLVMHLAGCEWIQMHQNIVISGPTGVGKTSLPVPWATPPAARGIPHATTEHPGSWRNWPHPGLTAPMPGFSIASVRSTCSYLMTGV
jgi:hypothetical protein